MKQGLSPDQLIQQLKDRRDKVNDYLVQGNTVSAWADQEVTEGPQYGLYLAGEVDSDFNVNPLCHGQIATKHKIPVAYARRIAEEYPELWAETFQTHFNNDKSGRLIRTIDGTARAYLSPNYAIRDNEPLLNAVIPVLKEAETMHGDFEIHSSYLDDDKMYLKISSPRLKGDVKVNDPVQMGIMVCNSEAGNGSTTIEPFIYRLICTNGMVRKDSRFKQRFTHLGSRMIMDDRLVQQVSSTTIEASNEAFFSGIQDLVRLICSPDLFQEYLERFQYISAKEIPTGIKIPDVIKRIETKFDMSEEESNLVLDSMIRSNDMTWWGTANAVTQAAESLDSYERATLFETLGAQISEMRESEWNSLVAV